ncbi:MAG: hypothetical protein KAQ79_12945, partial [Cyclobacteriaceae bacterium]|nr:hypothetical protein [Cyclobacteriaceae bacterium]
LVSYGDSKTVKVNLYNFKSQPQDISMRLWRILKGEYLLKVGKDVNNDGEIDSMNDILREEKLLLDRFSSIDLKIPSQVNIAIQLKLTRSIDKPASLPDLAIHPVKDIQQNGQKLIINIHNIGDGIAENISVEIMDKNDKVIAQKFISSMEAPVDLIPKIKLMEFDLNDKIWHKLVIDREDHIEELYKGNNVAINRF